MHSLIMIKLIKCWDKNLQKFYLKLFETDSIMS